MDIRTCDCCGEPGAKLTQVYVITVGEAEAMHEQDLCDKCRGEECPKLLAAAKVKHKEAERGSHGNK